MADSMLGSVARKLRIFGFDTLYLVHVEDSEVLKIGVDQDRVILTADKEFFKRIVKAKAKGVLVGGSDELEDLVHILEKNGIRSVDRTESRCSMCNGKLADVSPNDVQESLPEKIASNHKEFFRCASCGKIYWEGSHTKRIRLLAENLKSRLKSASVAHSLAIY
ncbi:MAG TPA: Mut7-C RNAse domain-containing protein [Nitrososphaera sp.]|nr:Mut7-C RNAse domain-containing protein [Nitrososphaera sp.]